MSKKIRQPNLTKQNRETLLRRVRGMFDRRVESIFVERYAEKMAELNALLASYLAHHMPPEFMAKLAEFGLTETFKRDPDMGRWGTASVWWEAMRAESLHLVGGYINIESEGEQKAELRRLPLLEPIVLPEPMVAHSHTLPVTPAILTLVESLNLGFLRIAKELFPLFSSYRTLINTAANFNIIVDFWPGAEEYRESLLPEPRVPCLRPEAEGDLAMVLADSKDAKTE